MAKSKKSKSFHHPLVIYILIFVLLFLFIWIVSTNTKKVTSMPSPSPSPLAIVATYECSGNKSIDATYTEGNVTLVLSDGRSMTLDQAMSASGARYANEDESIVFWNKGNTAFITEGDNMTYLDCVTSTN